MRRVIRLWHRRQRAITTTPATPRVEDATAQPAPMPEPATAPPVVDWSGYDINAAVDAIVANHIPALPRRVQQVVRETARAIRSDLTGAIFTADDLSLPDDPFIPDVEWAQRVYDHLWYCKRNMSIEQHNALYRLELTPRLGRTTFTIFAPPDWCEDRDAMQNIENALLNEVNSALALVITMPHTRFDWRPSPSLAVCWAVSIAAVDAPREGVA